MKQAAAAAGLTLALAGVVGGVYIAQQPERVEIVQPASGEPTPVPVDTTTTTAPPTTTAATTTPAPVASTTQAPAPKKVTTVTKQQTTVQQQAEPAPVPAPEKPAYNVPRPALPSGVTEAPNQSGDIDPSPTATP